jgi:hypothetical protein
MNLKKGLIRLFIVCSVISMVGGFFYTAPDANRNMEFQIQTIWDIEKNLKEPGCAAIANSNPDKFPEVTPKYGCAPLSIYWETIKNFQTKNSGKYPVINESLVSEAIWDGIRDSQREIALIGIAIGFAWNLLAWLFFLIMLYTYKWIRKGFQS